MNHHYTGWLEASPWGIIENETSEGQIVENIKQNDYLSLKYKDHLWYIQDGIDAFVWKYVSMFKNTFYKDIFQKLRTYGTKYIGESALMLSILFPEQYAMC